MTGNDIAQNIEDMISNGISGIHTACPATILSFDAGTCIATVKPFMSYYKSDGTTIDYPVVSGVPVFMPHAGNAQITYPVKAGDGCLLVFAERSTDEWIGKGNKDNHDPRRYYLTDAFCFVGMRPTQSISAENVELINNGTLVSVTPDNTVNIIGNVNIKGNVSIQGNYSCSGTSRMSGKIACDSDITAGSISVQNHTHTGVHGETSSAH